MTADTRYEPTGMVVQWIWTGGTVTLNSDMSNFTPGTEVDLPEVTAINDADRVYLAGLKDAAPSLKYFDTTDGGTVLEQAMIEGSKGSLLWGPQGTALGKPKRGIVAFVKSFKPTYDAGKPVEIDVEFQKTGAALYGPTSTW